MNRVDSFNFKIKNYKCFGDDPSGFEGIGLMNLIIGRNNSGKSSLLDLVDYVIHPKNLRALGHQGRIPEVLITQNLTEDELKRVFSPHTEGGPFRTRTHWDFGKQWVNRPLTWQLHSEQERGRFRRTFVSIAPPFSFDSKGDFQNGLARTVGNPFEGKIFKRLRSDRDIVPENYSNNETTVGIRENGQGVTSTITTFINSSRYPSELVERKLLEEMNRIFEPDSRFTDIVTQQHSNEQWEIFLQEETKGRVALSQSGSGLKTIILVLAKLYLIPFLEKESLAKYIFAFEELENNLHPAMQRRLLLYLRQIAEKHQCVFFLTTHSNIAIDLFSSDKAAQIVHVKHDGKSANSRPVRAYIERKGILDDLDVRASDLLQSNCVIWVEGPSDRLYMNRWIYLWTNGALREGAHYQCVFYGGRLLAHLSAVAEGDEPRDSLRILRVNSNAILIMDSDRKKKRQRINETKKRIVSEIKAIGGLSWVTGGKEIENYLPIQALQALYKKPHLKPLEQYEPFADYLTKRLGKTEAKKFLSNKVLFAERICPFIHKDHIPQTYDLSSQIDKICNMIKKWNR